MLIPHWPHHQCRWRGIITCLARTVEEIAANMRNMAQQNTIMQQLFMQMHGQTRYQVLRQEAFLQKEECTGWIATRAQRDPKPIEREVGMDASMNYTPLYPVVTLHNRQKTFPKYTQRQEPQRFVSVFDGIGSQRPRNRSQQSPPNQRRQRYKQGLDLQEVRPLKICGTKLGLSNRLAIKLRKKSQKGLIGLLN